MKTSLYNYIVVIGIYLAGGMCLLAQPVGKGGAASKAAKRNELLQESSDLAGRARSAQGEEARALRRQAASKRLTAELLSDSAPDAAAQQLAQDVLEDPTQGPAAKLEIERLQGRLARKSTRFASRADWVKARGAQALDLVKRYPDQPGAYEELLEVARLSPREQAVAHAQLVVASQAPEPMKAAARTIVRRGTIDGQHLATILNGVPDAGFLLKRGQGRTLVLYSWSPMDEASVLRAKELARSAPRGTLFVGINVGRDVLRALQRAEADGLPGEQLYGARGFDSPLVRQLGMTTAGLVYVVSGEGILRNLSEAQDVGAIFRKLN